MEEVRPTVHLPPPLFFILPDFPSGRAMNSIASLYYNYKPDGFYSSEEEEDLNDDVRRSMLRKRSGPGTTRGVSCKAEAEAEEEEEESIEGRVRVDSLYLNRAPLDNGGPSD